MLGLRWNTKEDCYYFDPRGILEAVEKGGKRLTKRAMLRFTARLFDPVGYLAPIIINVKALFQELWKMKLGWDEAVPEEALSTWYQFIDDLRELHNFKINRYLFAGACYSTSDYQLHIFGDASKKAYGAVAYLRAVFEDGSCLVRLICSKSRVALLKELSIPRLELLGALLASRLGDYLRAQLDLVRWNYFLWSDSTVALAWIVKEDRGRLAPWVKNRVDEITTLFNAQCWRHCPGTQNPADLVSRGATAKELRGLVVDSESLAGHRVELAAAREDSRPES